MTSTLDLTALFTDPALVAPDPDTGEPSPYAALRRLTDRLGDRPLLTDPDTLRTVLELAAVTDPRLFHTLFLHHCMAIGNAIDQGAADADVAALASGRWIGAALMTEAGRGNSSSGIRTEAEYDSATGEFVLHTPDADAAKHPVNVGRGGVARMGVVSARLRVGGVDRGTNLFLVALRDEHGPCPGVVIEPRPRTALLPVDYATVRFAGARVPYARWLRDGAEITAAGTHHDPLDGPGTRSRRSVSMSRFAWGAVTAGLGAVARAAVVRALAHARGRRTLDRLAGECAALDHLNQQRLLCTATAAALAATVVAHRTTADSWRLAPDGDGPAPTTMRNLSIRKVATGVLADTAVTLARSSAGASGFFSGNGYLEYQGLTTAFRSAGGDNRLILLDAAWSLVHDPDYPAPEPDSVQDHWAELFGHRERLLYTELEQGLDTPDGLTFATWNRHTELAQRLGEAHAARLTAEALHEQWHGPAAPPAHRTVLADLYQLSCLEEVAAHDGWYLAHDLLSASEVLALPGRIDDVCRRLITHVDVLVELLDIPAQLVRGTAG
ncbi:acyl-CoA dehydrogenase [Nocardia sp. alder85J]|uniref:acyl-CoA dehydrogenase n=1 Tax=Nocardia sp. alder85J TaxID=2862949 RepID=UPI001CD2E959|nr:acyl-CoA dehydrogenase [Nocardia sp. alder85J]MCX4092552.1 hypothetical protein [Nocardia sp. alder85J]